MDALDFETAKSNIERAIKVDRTNARALELRALLFLEEGKPEQAQMYLKRAVEMEPDEGHSKYMYLGQLSTGVAAANYYSRGIDILAGLTEELREEGDMEGLYDAQQNISIAFTALAELYLTDLWCDELA